jgi:uncharacterized protein (TIGR02996 family)
MDVQAAILAAIADRPADDTPRLAYADWLDDHAEYFPDPAAARARAEFIRVQCEVKRLEHLPNALLQGYADLYRRQDALLTHHRRDLLGPLSDALGPHDAVFDRGFVTELGLDAAAFVQHASFIASLTPRPDVSVTVPHPTAEFLGSPHLELVTAVRWQSLASPPDGDYPVPPRWDRLRVLNVSGCEVDDVHLHGLVGTRDRSLPALTDFDVSWNAITDEGVRSLVASPLWPRLRVLVIGSNPISDIGAKVLAEAPATTLKYLNVARTGMTSDGRNRLLGREGWKVDLF